MIPNNLPEKEHRHRKIDADHAAAFQVLAGKRIRRRKLHKQLKYRSDRDVHQRVTKTDQDVVIRQNFFIVFQSELSGKQINRTFVDHLRRRKGICDDVPKRKKGHEGVQKHDGKDRVIENFIRTFIFYHTQYLTREKFR